MKLISNDLRDGDKLPHRHIFNGMGYDGFWWNPFFPSAFNFVVYVYEHNSKIDDYGLALSPLYQSHFWLRQFWRILKIATVVMTIEVKEARSRASPVMRT